MPVDKRKKPKIEGKDLININEKIKKNNKAIQKKNLMRV